MGIEDNFGVKYGAKAVILATGTFLRALHNGRRQHPAGRQGEPASNELPGEARKTGDRTGQVSDGNTA